MTAAPRRCTWCHGTQGELREVTLPATAVSAEETVLVHPEHEEELRRLHRRGERHWRTYLWALGGFVAAVVLFEVVLLVAHRAAGLAGIGLTVGLFGGVLAGIPLPTPQTVGWLGARRAVAATRASGVVLAAAGVALVALAFL